MMWKWLDQNAQPLQGLGTIITAMAALIAVIVVPIQIGAADRIQREQTAREIYREFLNLTVNKPEVAAADYCALKEAKDIAGYEAYVEYLLYTAEQMISTDEAWRAPMSAYMADHMGYICTQTDWQTQSAPVVAIIEELRKNCKVETVCNGG
jgi:hypothetical protein